jgi:hypothetical protein
MCAPLQVVVYKKQAQVSSNTNLTLLIYPLD